MSTPSLLRLFEPPEDYEGQFGWVCGFSADAGFLDAAAERFTCKPTSARARHGQLVLGVMLDPFHEPISVLDVPGVADLPLRTPMPPSAVELVKAFADGWRVPAHALQDCTFGLPGSFGRLAPAGNRLYGQLDAANPGRQLGPRLVLRHRPV